MRVSIIIPTYHRPERLAACLDSIEQLAYPLDSFEVIVVDDGSPTPVLSAPRPYSLRIIRQENAGPAAARNRGVVEARGELLAFLDDDCQPQPDWLRAMEAAWEPKALIGGSTFNACTDNRYAVFNQKLVDAVCGWFREHSSPLAFFTSNNLLVEAEEYRRMGGFSTAFTTAAEDRDFAVRWREAGGHLIGAPEARIDHYHSQTFRSFLRMHFRYGRGAAVFHALRRTHPAQYAAAGLYVDLWRQTRSIVLLTLSQLAAAAGYYFEVTRPWLGAMAVYLCLALAWQYQSNAWQVELSGPDEASHFTNGVMVSQYWKSGRLDSPMAFARDYYEHYPKVALGHWPPLFSLMLGAWFLMAPPGPSTALLPVALFLAALATLVYCQVITAAPRWLAFGAGLLVLVSPLGRSALLQLGIEPASAFLMALAVVWFAHSRFTGFGVWAAAALLTKANAGALALVPVLEVLLGKRWELLRRVSFWKPAAIVGLIALPWYLYAWPWMAGEILPGRYFGHLRRAWLVLRYMIGETAAPLPITLILLAMAGWFWKRDEPRARAWAALAIAVFLFHTIVTPHGESRFYLSALAPVLILAGWTLARLPALAAASVWLGLVILSGNPFVAKPNYGITPAVDFVRSHAGPAPRVALVASQADGEGAAIAVFVQREPRPAWHVLRASKMLASSTWHGFFYQSRFTTPAEVAAYLDESPVSAVIFDHRPGVQRTHHGLLLAALQGNSWRVAFEDGLTTVYSPTRPVKPAGQRFRQELTRRLAK